MPTLYDVEGLTHQGELDLFWQEAEMPTPDLLHTLIAGLTKTIQVRGTLYKRAGRKAAATAVAHKILSSDGVSGPLMEEYPPRFAKAKRLGVTYD